MRQQLTAYLARRLQAGDTFVAAQFVRPATATPARFPDDDPLSEEARYSPVKGIVHKFPNRVLWKVSYRCAAHCQFCTRVRQIGSPEGDLSQNDIDQGLLYLDQHSEVDDVILSGGDPFATPRPTVAILRGLARIHSVKVIRVGTRLPIQAPDALTSLPVRGLLHELAAVTDTRPLFILVNVEHPDELTDQVCSALARLKATGATLLSQTVFLKSVNDDPAVLRRLFTALYHLGVIPYYLYRCDYVQGLERFVCDMNAEREIVTQLRRELSGIAMPTYVVDVPGRGKVPVPLAFWDGTDLSRCRDFDGQSVQL